MLGPGVQVFRVCRFRAWCWKIGVQGVGIGMRVFGVSGNDLVWGFGIWGLGI